MEHVERISQPNKSLGLLGGTEIDMRSKRFTAEKRRGQWDFIRADRPVSEMVLTAERGSWPNVDRRNVKPSRSGRAKVTGSTRGLVCARRQDTGAAGFPSTLVTQSPNPSIMTIIYL